MDIQNHQVINFVTFAHDLMKAKKGYLAGDNCWNVWTRYSKVEAVTYSVLVYFLEHTVKSMFTLQRPRRN